MVEDLSKKIDTLMTKMQSLEKEIKDSKKQDSSVNDRYLSGHNRRNYSRNNTNSFTGYNRTKCKC
jgi:hypothetical protein